MLRLLKNLVKFTAILIAGIYLSVWALSPFIANHFIAQYLEQHELELENQTTIRYNPFLSRLTIDSLVVKNQKADVLSLSSLSLEISAYQLISRELNVSELLIDGLYLVIDKQAESLSIAGIRIPTAEKTVIEESDVEPSHSVLESAEQQDSESDVKSVEPDFQLLMPEMRLTDSKIDIIENGQLHSLKLKNIGLHVDKITPNLQNLSLSLLAEFNKADIALSASTEMVNQLGQISFDVEVKDANIHKFSHLFTPQVTLKNGFVSYKGKHNIKLMKEGVRLEVADLGFKTQGIEVNKNDIHFTLGEQQFNSPLMTVDVRNNTQLTVAGKGDLLWQDVNVFNKTTNEVLVAMSQLALSGFDLYSSEGQYKVTIDTTSLLDSFFSNNTENDIPALTAFSALTVNDVELTNQSLVINTVELAGLKSDVQLDKDKQIKNLILTLDQLTKAIAGSVSETEGEAEAVAAEELASQNTPLKDNADQNVSQDASQVATKNSDAEFHLQLNKFSLVDSANIQFTDQSVSPIYARFIKVNELSAGPFDNQKPNQTSVIKVAGISNNYTSFDIAIDAKPFLAAQSYTIKGSLNQLDLESLSAYVKTALGYEIESGQLDLAMDVKLIGSQIDGNSHILLRGIELSSVDDYESKESSNQSYIPFNTALGMLKDSDGNVELDLPVSGDTNSPSFGLSGFVTLLVKQATIAGAKEYLTMTFVPYASLVKIVMAADKHLLKIEISDLNYTPMEFEVTEDKDTFVSTFTKLLKDKTDLQIKMCGVSTAEDIGKDKGKKLSKDDIEMLIRISEQRANNFKKFMVEEKEVSPSRLLLCKPRIDNTMKAMPHIMFET
jgi:hypothetical protein